MRLPPFIMSIDVNSSILLLYLLCFASSFACSVSLLLLLLVVVVNVIMLLCTKKRGMFCHSLLPSLTSCYLSYSSLRYITIIILLWKRHHEHHLGLEEKALPSLLLKGKVYPLTQNILPHKGLSFMKAFFHIATFAEHK